MRRNIGAISIGNCSRNHGVHHLCLMPPFARRIFHASLCRSLPSLQQVLFEVSQSAPLLLLLQRLNTSKHLCLADTNRAYTRSTVASLVYCGFGCGGHGAKITSCMHSWSTSADAGCLYWVIASHFHVHVKQSSNNLQLDDWKCKIGKRNGRKLKEAKCKN